MLARDSSLVEQLGNLEGDDPGEVREQVVQNLSDSVPCDFALFYTFVRHQGEYRHSSMTGVGDEDLVEMANRLEGCESTTYDHWKPEAPKPSERDQFVTMRYEPDRLVAERDDWLLREFYGDHHIPAQARALLYAEGELVGWIGVMRRRSEPFDSEVLECLQQLTPTLKTALQTADRMEDEALEGPADVLFEPEGPTVEYASEEARSWLTAERIEWLERIVRRVARRGEFPEVTVSEGRLFRIARLDGDLGVRYAVTVERAERPVLGPIAALTPRQREVAEYAAVGATAAEIAETLDIAAATVRDHVRSIYDRLGIASRAELAAKLSKPERQAVNRSE